MKRIDYLIVGQGIAGTLLAYFLLKKGKSICIVDDLSTNSSSHVAAGIFNPITGRRFVKTWKADEIFPFAEKTYRDLEQDLGSAFYFPKSIIRNLSDEAEMNEWKRKSHRPEYADYTGKEFIENGVKKVEILKGGNLKLSPLIDLMRKRFKEKDILEEVILNYSELVISKEFVEWKNYHAGRVIFCEGINSLQNPWFGHLPFTHAKGDILTIHCVDLRSDHIINKGIFILPIGNDNYRVGATYDWNDLTGLPSEKGRLELIHKLDKILKYEYTIVDHQAGIRPTVKDRRPLIGIHPEIPQLGIFNGLGTKGVSLGPYFAHHFVNFLEEDLPLNREVDISRFD